jgi:arylsulfatase A-like enzyme
MVDTGLLIITILLGIILYKEKWNDFLNFIWMSPVKWLSIGFIILLFLLNLGVFIDEKLDIPESPNVIFIVIDTFRTDHLSCYGYQNNTSPNIDEFSSRATLFKNAFAPAPWTTPSVASLLTSQYPAVLGYRGKPVVLKDKFLTLAEIFHENNYKTKGIVSHDYISATLGFDQGFDSYDEDNAKGHGYISSPLITEKAISFLTKNSNNNFFLFLHYFDPHFDYILHKEYNYYPDYKGPIYSGQNIKSLLENAPYMSKEDLKYIRALYDSEIRFTDEYLGKLFEKLKEMQLFDNTLIILTADHGEEFSERGDYWIGHGKKLYQELIHVPLIIKLPEQNKGKVIREYVGLIDLTTTAVHLSGLEIPLNYNHDGEVIDFKNKMNRNDKFIFSETESHLKLKSVIWNGWKLIHGLEMNQFQLYNLENDPGECNNVFDTNEQIRTELMSHLGRWNNHIKLRTSDIKFQKPEFSEEQKARLKALGYL